MHKARNFQNHWFSFAPIKYIFIKTSAGAVKVLQKFWIHFIWLIMRHIDLKMLWNVRRETSWSGKSPYGSTQVRLPNSTESFMPFPCPLHGEHTYGIATKLSFQSGGYFIFIRRVSVTQIRLVLFATIKKCMDSLFLKDKTEDAESHNLNVNPWPILPITMQQEAYTAFKCQHKRRKRGNSITFSNWATVKRH